MSVVRSEKIRFPGATGATLVARLERPAGEPIAYALFAHCFTCGKDLKAAARIGKALVKHGYGVLRFDFTGLGESEGDFADTNFSSNVADLLAAVEFLRQRFQAPRLVIGHSLGGAAVLQAAAQIPEAVAVATIGAPSSTDHLKETLLRGAPELKESDDAQVTLGGRTFRIKRQMLEDLEASRVTKGLGELHKALLIMHSPVDEVVAIDHARRIYEAAGHPKSFVSLDDADHLLLRNPMDAEYAAGVLAAWARRYLPNDAVDRVASAESRQPPVVAEGEVFVEGGADGLTQTIRTGRHTQLSDEPIRVGGTDRGPNPYDYLLAALGACTSMTLKMYADRKKWPLESVRVRLTHDRIHAADCAECRTKSGRVDRIRRVVAIEGELDADQRSRLLEIADRCPVHRTLSSEIHIETSAAEKV